MVHYINVQTIVALVQLPMAGVLGMEQSQNLLAALGVKNVKYYASVNGLDQEEFVSRALAATDGEPTGLLSMVGGEPLTPQSLVTIPDDASFAVAARVDPEKVLETFINLAAILDPQAPVELDQSIAQLTQLTGVHLKDDIFDALGDTWCLYNSPGDGGLVVTGLTLTVTLRDREKLVQANDRLVAVGRQMMEQDHRQGADATSIREIEFAGQHLFFLNFMSPDSPVSPAWCITDKQLIVSLYPANDQIVSPAPRQSSKWKQSRAKHWPTCRLWHKCLPAETSRRSSRIKTRRICSKWRIPSSNSGAVCVFGIAKRRDRRAYGHVAECPRDRAAFGGGRRHGAVDERGHPH